MYDAHDLAHVKAGDTNPSTGSAYKPWDVVPTWWDLSLPFTPSAGNIPNFWGAAYDATNQLIYLSQSAADTAGGSYSLIHVYQVVTELAINGTCGSAAGGTFASLSSVSPNLCSTGTVANFTGTGPWTWGCQGQNGGTSSGTCPAALLADTTPPVFSGGYPAGQLPYGTTQANIGGATDENATCRYSSASGTAWASMSTMTVTGGMSHSVLVSGLADSQSYDRYVKCQDAAGNQSGDYHISFSVASPPVGTANGMIKASGTASVNQ